MNLFTKVLVRQPLTRRQLLLVSMAASAQAPQAARLADDAERTFRSVAQAARTGLPPPPPVGVRDLAWAALSAPGWDARAALRRWTRFQVQPMAEDDPRIQKVAAGLRQEWDQAPTVQPPSGLVRLIAFASPAALARGRETISAVLTPYRWDGIEAPAPPANQMVLATLNRPWPVDQQRYPLWITGRLELRPSSTRIGRVAYRMGAAAWEPYPYSEHPLPQYQWPH